MCMQVEAVVTLEGFEKLSLPDPRPCPTLVGLLSVLPPGAGAPWRGVSCYYCMAPQKGCLSLSLSPKFIQPPKHLFSYLLIIQVHF